MKKRNYLLIAAAALVVIATLFLLRGMKGSAKNITAETVTLTRGSISNTVTATGTLEAITTVEVGTQVSGVIEKILVDFNSEVKKGQVLAKLDQTSLIAQLEQSKATVDQAQAEVNYQKANFERHKVLADKKLIAQSDYDLVVYNYEKAVASLRNARSVYEKNRINLAYATIYSPIDGIILDRAVDEGQTVAASFNTPTLFTIANDLTQMRVEASVDEADIGQVKMGQRSEFKVSTYPNRVFNGTVTEIRLQPVTTSNVVTYTVVVDAPNPDKNLMPGMTADITIFTDEKMNIVVVPGKAVRFSPDGNLLLAYNTAHNLKNSENHPFPGAGTNGETFLWIRKGMELQKVKVELGATDGINYELISGATEGDELVVALQEAPDGKEAKASEQASGSPFMPPRPGANRRTN